MYLNSENTKITSNKNVAKISTNTRRRTILKGDTTPEQMTIEDLERVPDSNEIISFSCQKNVIQQMVDPRYVIKYKMDEFVNNDRTLRFYATDQNLDESIALKLYFKNHPKTCEFENMQIDEDFKESIDDCNQYHILNNRLYNLPADNIEPIDVANAKPLYNDIFIPRCITPKVLGKGRTHFINIFTLPEGENLKEKCIHELGVTKINSCVSDLRIIATGLLHAMALYNSQNRFFKHANLYPQNIYLYMKNENRKVFLDNMIYDNQKYDDIESKSFKTDFNMLADLFIMLLTGSEEVKLREPLLSSYDLFLQLKEFVESRHIEVNLKTNNLGVPEGFMKNGNKCQTVTEMDYKLQKSVFNFIYRLKCAGTRKEEQFMEISQALEHEFIRAGAGSDEGGNGENGGKPKMETWNAIPADY
jgi:hypothetical protein